MKHLFLLFLCSNAAFAQQNNCHFDAHYIAQNTQKCTYEILEVQELAHIIIALTLQGVEDSVMINHNTPYYKAVLAHFSMYKNEKIVQDFQKILHKNSAKYFDIKMSACGFYFENNKINNDAVYKTMNWNANTIFLKPFLRKMEDFALKTDFRNFYKSHQTHYDSLTAMLQTQADVEREWRWLEQNFSARYNSYRILFSPLSQGMHSTRNFENNGFRQAVMFVSLPFENVKYSKNINKAKVARIVFTEIDHNYVNPVSDIYFKKIKKAFKNKEKWANQTVFDRNYTTQYKIFNEYMTWSVFNLYAYEHFSASDFETINQQVENVMIDYRGFINFQAFNQKLLDIYKKRPKNTPIQALYPEILAWCEQN
jgi:Domain of unknown function (DUF4932)